MARLACPPLHGEQRGLRFSCADAHLLRPLPRRVLLAGGGGSHRRNRRRAGAPERRCLTASTVQRREARRHRRLRHLRVRAGVLRLARVARARASWNVGRRGDAPVERLRFQQGRREDRRSLLHWLSVYWNIVVFYLFVAGWPPELNLVILLGLSVLVFVPIHYLYAPSRSPVFRRLTVGLGASGAFWSWSCSGRCRACREQSSGCRWCFRSTTSCCRSGWTCVDGWPLARTRQ